MTKRLHPLAAAAIVVPLLAAAIILPSGLDEAVPPAIAGGAALAWAALVAVAAGWGASGTGAALAAAMPFCAYALSAFSPAPAWP
ncbi:MAG: hypothetical protein KKB59_03690, partial [Spirochaetes bacterium]|nr:hypothetical protein [Spirochaetota bacterium]